VLIHNIFKIVATCLLQKKIILFCFAFLTICLVSATGQIFTWSFHTGTETVSSLLKTEPTSLLTYSDRHLALERGKKYKITENSVSYITPPINIPV